jgi:transcriptional regulator with PAS, ATPase and Fis domain
MVGESAAMRRVVEQVYQVAPTDSTVLLLGETGTGKELLAAEVHERSPRRGRPMVRVNCAAIPATLIESELFGREKGAFTGALARQIGRFELADHSTIFLDEIGDLPIELQVKLLRVIEQRELERLGSPRPIPVNVRIIAATHRNLEERLIDGRFREDLYYRLNVFPIAVPPLRERGMDVDLLVWRMVGEFSKSFGKRIDSIDDDSMAALRRHTWPGNVRELKNVLACALAFVESGMIEPHYVRFIAPPAEHVGLERLQLAGHSLVGIERVAIRQTLQQVRGNKVHAAKILGIAPSTLYEKVKKYGL